MAGTSRHLHFRCSCIPASMNPMTITMSTYRPSDGAANVHDGFDEKNTYYLNESRCTWKNFFGRFGHSVTVGFVTMGDFRFCRW
jgi:hypothetical protein